MPTIKFTEVLSFSSEDPNHPAENLLSSETFRKWKCAPGTVGNQSTVTMKLERLSSIHSIDIGNEGSAFVEVLVGREGAGDFQLLLVASSFMSPIESRNSTDLNRVRMFGPDKLNKNVACQKWDRIKVICTQPFNKNMQYGLSFITVRALGEEPTSSSSRVTKLGSFTLKEEDDSDPISIGSMFARRKEKESSPTISATGAAAIRAASAAAVASSTSPGALKRKAQGPPSDVGFYQLKKKADLDKDPGKISTVTKTEEFSSSSTPHKKGHNGGKDRQKKYDPKSDRKEVRHRSSENGGKDRKEENSKNRISKEEKKTDKPSVSGSTTAVSDKTKKTKPFRSLMDNIVFVLSGYQNPQRSQLREMMLEMGASYKADWEPGCTHLICAFTNTPKYQQVKGRGKIITAKWVTDCHRNKIRYSCKRYELEKEHNQNESEEEIWADELLPKESKPVAKPAPPPSFAAATVPDEDDYGHDTDMSDNENTDDEIERVLARHRKNEDFSSKTNTAKNTRPDNRNGMAENEDTAYPKVKVKKDREVMMSDVKETKIKDARVANGTMTLPDTSNLPLPPLGDYFKGKFFFIYGKMAEEKKKLLHRYIIAFNGDVEDYMNEKVKFVITDEDWDENFDEALNENSSLQFVKPLWIWRCSDKQKLVPHQPFLIVPKE